MTQPLVVEQSVKSKRPLVEPAIDTWWSRNRRAVGINTGRIGLLLAILILWQLISGPIIDPMFLSNPIDIGKQFWEWIVDGTLWRHSQTTVIEVMAGYALGALAGIVLAYILAPIPIVQKIVDPFFYALYSLPKVALAPLFIVWFGIGISMKVLLAAITVFFLVFLNTLAGVRQVDKEQIAQVKLMGASRLQLITKVMWPGSLAGVFTGLKIAVPYALIGAVIGELVAANRGIGFLVVDSASRFNTAGVFAAIIVLTLLALLLNGIISLVDSRASRWRGDA